MKSYLIHSLAAAVGVTFVLIAAAQWVHIGDNEHPSLPLHPMIDIEMASATPASPIDTGDDRGKSGSWVRYENDALGISFIHPVGVDCKASSRVLGKEWYMISCDKDGAADSVFTILIPTGWDTLAEDWRQIGSKEEIVSSSGLEISKMIYTDGSSVGLLNYTFGARAGLSQMFTLFGEEKPHANAQDAEQILEVVAHSLRID